MGVLLLLLVWVLACCCWWGCAAGRGAGVLLLLLPWVLPHRCDRCGAAAGWVSGWGLAICSGWLAGMAASIHPSPPVCRSKPHQNKPTQVPACLPAGGYGPKLESWAFGVDQDGLEALLREGVFQLRTCKLCDEGIVVKGEYGLTNSLMKYGYNVDTLMSMYRGVSRQYKRLVGAGLVGAGLVGAGLAGWLAAALVSDPRWCRSALVAAPDPQPTHAPQAPSLPPACRLTGGTGGTGGATTMCTPRGTAPMAGSRCTPLRPSSSRPPGTWGSRLWTNTLLGCWPRWVLGAAGGRAGGRAGGGLGPN